MLYLTLLSTILSSLSLPYTYIAQGRIRTNYSNPFLFILHFFSKKPTPMRFSQVAFSITLVTEAISAGPISGDHRQLRAQLTLKNGQDAQALNEKFQCFVLELVLQRWRRGVHAGPGRTVRRASIPGTRYVPPSTQHYCTCDTQQDANNGATGGLIG